MTVDSYLIIQIVTFVCAVLVFDSLEHFFPGFSIRKQQQLSLNMLSMAIVVFAGEYWKAIIARGFNAINLSSLLTGNRLAMLPPAAKMALADGLSDSSLY